MKGTIILIIAVLLSTGLFATNKKDAIKVQGKVSEQINGKQYPMDKAYVYCENSLNCTFSDINGNFELELPKGKHTIKISFKGYEGKEVTYKVKRNSKDISIVMEKLAEENLADKNINEKNSFSELLSE
jgi:hypothetical protein